MMFPWHVVAAKHVGAPSQVTKVHVGRFTHVGEPWQVLDQLQVAMPPHVTPVASQLGECWHVERPGQVGNWLQVCIDPQVGNPN
ncbi:MAG: hypothetical protein AB1792_11010 [Candidatus Zixiibacteriota bacterium]